MDLKLRVRDSLSRRDIQIEPREDNQVHVYACGPTIYNFQHIGNFRKFIFDDLLVRTLEGLGYDVRRVMNITDVGHLTSDGDEGEDKMEVAVRREATDVESIIEKYTVAFDEDWKALRLAAPTERPRASHHIAGQIELVKLLIDKGHAYDTDEAVYYDISSFPGYGALTGQDMSERVVGARDEVVTETSKRNPADFAVWFKRVGPHKNAIQHWDSPWGAGFPGWHLECSALAHEFLAHPMEIHTGGVDHLFPHHTNEIAQSEGAYGAPFSRAWMHSEHMLVDGEKMSKSLGNGYLLKDLVDRGFSPADFRYLVMTAHYRTRINFTWEALEAARAGRRRLNAEYWRIRSKGRVEGVPDDGLMAGFWKALADDLGSPQAIASMHLALKLPDEGIRLATLGYMDTVLSVLDETAPETGAAEVPQEVAELVAKREEARANKQFMQSDALRDEVRRLGYEIEDSPAGPVISPITT